MKKLTSFFLIFTLTSCFGYKPILDQNDKFFQTKKEERQDDIKQCSKQADDYLQEYKMRRAAKEAARKALIGTAIGAATGLIFGNNLKSIATKAAIGAGVGDAFGALSVASEGNVTPDQIKQHYISNCLAYKGYQVIGFE